jgi:hypothetical protein
MQKHVVQSRPFSLVDSEAKPTDQSGFTDEDLKWVFEQVPFDFDPIPDENGDEDA